MSASSSYLARSTRQALRLNWSMARRFSALRRAAIMAFLYVVGTHWLGGSAGYFLAIGAVFGGFLDRGDTSMRVAARGTFALAGTTLVFGGLTALLAGWDVAAVLTVGVCAAASGIASAVSMTAARVLAYTAVLAVANVVAPDGVAAALQATVLLSVGVLCQAIGTGLAAVVDGDLIERRRLARALRAVAAALGQAADPATTAVADSHGLVAALSAAEAMVDTWNLPPSRAEQFARVLEAAHDLRVEAIASVRRHVDPGSVAAGASTLSAAGAVLTGAASLLSARSWSRAARERRLRDAVASLPAVGEAARTLPDRLVVDCAERIARECEAIASRPRPEAARRTSAAPLRDRLRDGLRPGSVPARHAMRLGLAAVISAVVAIFVDDAHSSWIAITAIIVLRPDIPSTSVRTIGRVIGTATGAVVVIALALAVGSDPERLAAIAMLFALVTFVFQMVSYASFVFGLVGVIIMLTAISSGDPVAVAGARILDVAAGSLIAVLASWIVPIWSTSSLPQRLADYARLTGDWFGSFGTDLQRGLLRPETNDDARRRVRAAAQRLRTTMATADAEPADRRVDVEQVRAIEAAVTDAVRQALAAVAIMREEPREDEAAGGCALRASHELLDVAATLERADRIVVTRPVPTSTPEAEQRPVTAPAEELRAVMCAAERESRRALALARSVTSAASPPRDPRRR